MILKQRRHIQDHLKELLYYFQYVWCSRSQEINTPNSVIISVRPKKPLLLELDHVTHLQINQIQSINPPAPIVHHTQRFVPPPVLLSGILMLTMVLTTNPRVIWRATTRPLPPMTNGLRITPITSMVSSIRVLGCHYVRSRLSILYRFFRLFLLMPSSSNNH